MYVKMIVCFMFCLLISNDLTAKSYTWKTEKKKIITFANGKQFQVDMMSKTIKDIEESPEGDYDEDDIESAIDSYVDDNEDNFIGFIRDQGFGNEEILNFVDIDAIKDYIIRNDSWGDILGSYDGSEDEFNINGHIYIVMRYN